METKIIAVIYLFIKVYPILFSCKKRGEFGIAME